MEGQELNSRSWRENRLLILSRLDEHSKALEGLQASLKALDSKIDALSASSIKMPVGAKNQLWVIIAFLIASLLGGAGVSTAMKGGGDEGLKALPQLVQPEQPSNHPPVTSP